ncbi:MAG: transglutaminase-like domain-containing protein [Thermoguttaceae bacterium]|nr:transglutaminase-like domain-containing protein [Thermoguttaceae bacterium]MDW8078175.1 transglutaminase-like domain-containing protein [Thermoguttaceae bacterium]
MTWTHKQLCQGRRPSGLFYQPSSLAQDTLGGELVNKKGSVNRLGLLLLVTFISLECGCFVGERAETVRSRPGPSQPSQAAEVVADATSPTVEGTAWDWTDQGEPISGRELWDIAYVAGSKVGYEHTIIEERKRRGRPLVRIVQKQVLSLRRFSETVSTTFELESWQTPEGQLLVFRGKQEQGILPIEFFGWAEGNSLVIEQKIGGRKERQQLPWDKSYGGFRAVEESLKHHALRPGEKWTVRYLLPVFNVVAQTDLEVKGPELVPLLSGTYELLRVDTRTTAPGGFELTGTFWVDQSGEILKSYTDLMKLETYRGTREEALAESAGIALDWGEDIRVPLAGTLDRPHESEMVRYRVLLEGGDAARLFAVGPTQAVRRLENGAVEITVYALRPGRKSPISTQIPDDPPKEADCKPGPYIQSDYPAIVELAAKSTAGLNAPWDIAVALERVANQWITDSNYKVGFATAAEVVDSRQGDCTEHALLLAALARAQNIPARVAMGLVYNNKAFYYHMWTEVWIDNMWYPLDATLARGGIGAAHLKMATSSLENSAALARMLPLLQAVGKLKIEILEARYPSDSPQETTP